MRIPRNERVSSDIAETGPERKCILSGAVEPRDSLIRLAISPEGRMACASSRLMCWPAPGPRAWIGVSRAELEAAIAKGRLKGALARAFKGAKLPCPPTCRSRSKPR
jgi:predicted RNA-binding protein YlxR (DUF448 family)